MWIWCYYVIIIVSSINSGTTRSMRIPRRGSLLLEYANTIYKQSIGYYSRTVLNLVFIFLVYRIPVWSEFTGGGVPLVARLTNLQWILCHILTQTFACNLLYFQFSSTSRFTEAISSRIVLDGTSAYMLCELFHLEGLTNQVSPGSSLTQRTCHSS